MARVSLSREELCFALLIESHTAVCQIFFSIVVDAMETADPENWKEAVSSCFGHGVGQYVKQRLDNGLVETDFYAVCKLLRSRLRDVANLYGGKILDPYKRERLSLQIQGVETARHWLFHGEQYLSPRELCSNLTLLATILTCLSRDQEKSFGVLQRLHLLWTYANELATLNPHGEYPICSAAVRSAALHTALKELKQNFTAFLHQRKPNTGHKRKGTGSTKTRADVGGDYSNLFGEIRRTSSELSKKDRVRVISDYHQPLSVTDMCKNLCDLRNASAHGRQLSLSETKSGVCQIREILAAFRLSNERTKLLQNNLEDLQDIESDGRYLCSLEREEADDATDSANQLNGKRILRSKGQHFIGRKEEFSKMTSLLKDNRCEATSKRILLVSGPPGIGKSHLAAQVANSVRRTYKTQTWLSCSSPFFLEQDLRLLCNFQTVDEGAVLGPHSASEAASKLSNAWSAHAAHCHSLVVFDDVCVSTMSIVYELLSRSSLSAIVTTKSPIVGPFFQAHLCSLHVVQPKAFLLEESQELVARKVNVSGFDAPKLASIDKVLRGVLGNLPLAVNVYSSLLAVSLKKPEKTAFDVFDEQLVIKNWENIEELFGDRFHVRGFTGVVQSAKKYLQKFPFVMFLLAKICLTDSESLPWEALQRSAINYYQESYTESMMVQLDCGLLGVTDWLFAEAGRKTLEICRYELEELGLVSWEESTLTVHIHRLTLRSAKTLLEANHYFMEDLLYVLSLSNRFSDNTNITGETISLWLSVELLGQILHKCVEILGKAVAMKSFDTHQDVLQRSYPILKIAERLAAGSMQSSARKVWSMLSGLLFDLRVLAVSYSRILGISNAKDQLPFKMLKQARPKDDFVKAGRYSQMLLYYSVTGMNQIEAGMFKEARESFENALKLDKIWSGEHSVDAALNHCLIAQCIECEAGPLARRTYLQEASRRCPQLLILPKAEDVRQVLFALRKCSKRQIECSEHEARINLWSHILNFQIDNEMSDYGVVEKATFEVALLLIKYYQQEQQLVLAQVRQVQKHSIQPHIIKVWRAAKLMEWISLAGYAGGLFLRMEQDGFFLRMVLNLLPVIKEDILTGLDQSIFLSEQSEAYSKWAKWLVVHYIHSSSFVGHFSLAEELCRSLAGSLSKIQTLPLRDMSLESGQKENKPLICTIANGENETAKHNVNVVWIDCSLRLCQQIRQLHESVDFEGALNGFTKLVEQTCSWHPGIGKGLGGIALDYIVCLSSLLGGDVGFRALTTIRGWAGDTRTYPSWKLALEKATKEISRQLEESELSAMCSDFLESRKALKDDQLSVRRFSLRCWKAIARFFTNPVRKMPQTNVFMAVILSVLLHLAENLQMSYSEEGKVDHAEWFCSFRFLSSRRGKRYLSAARNGMEYAEFLLTRARQAEAVDQRRLVENILAEHFGEDYEEWLSDVPQTNTIFHELSAHGSN